MAASLRVIETDPRAAAMADQSAILLYVVRSVIEASEGYSFQALTTGATDNNGWKERE